MKFWSFLPDFNRSQRRGILLLLLFIFLGQVMLLSLDKFYPVQSESVQIPSVLQQEYDSLKTLALQKRQKKIYPFNPNYLTDYKGYYLGLNLSQIDRVLAFRKTGQYFQSKLQFKRIAQLSDTLYQKLEPYIKIPVFKNYKFNHKPTHALSTNDINLATAEDLETIVGIGPVLSKRIVKYRKAVGGFKDRSQLLKVYGLEPDVIKRVWQHFKLKNTKSNSAKNSIKKAINTATIADLKQIYGIGEKLARRLIKYRQSIGGFTIKEQLNAVYGLSPEVITRIWENYQIKNPAKIPFKIDLNEANIKELAENPYISYQLAKKIISYRTLHGAFHKFDALLKVPEYPEDQHKQICLYLKL